MGQKESDHTFETYYNGALLAFKLGDFQVGTCVRAADEIYDTIYVTYFL